MWGCVGWNLTTQGVRRCPVSTFRHWPVRWQMILTVWSPLHGNLKTSARSNLIVEFYVFHFTNLGGIPSNLGRQSAQACCVSA